MFRLSTVERWRKLILPGIFPYLITGFVTAPGGVWDASLVAEYFRFHGQNNYWIGLHHQPRHRHRQLSRAACGNDCDGFDGCHSQSIALAGRLYAMDSGRFSMNS